MLKYWGLDDNNGVIFVDKDNDPVINVQISEKLTEEERKSVIEQINNITI